MARTRPVVEFRRGGPCPYRVVSRSSPESEPEICWQPQKPANVGSGSDSSRTRANTCPHVLCAGSEAKSELKPFERPRKRRQRQRRSAQPRGDGQLAGVSSRTTHRTTRRRSRSPRLDARLVARGSLAVRCRGGVVRPPVWEHRKSLYTRRWRLSPDVAGLVALMAGDGIANSLSLRPWWEFFSGLVLRDLRRRRADRVRGPHVSTNAA